MKNEIKELLRHFNSEYRDGAFEKAIHLLKAIISLGKKGDFWTYSRLSSCYYELKDYHTALTYAKKAYKLNPTSPLVLWDYAGALIMLEKESRAIKLLRRIQEMSDDLRDHGFNNSDIKWMQSLKNDANFLIGKSYYTIHKDSLAKKSFEQYITNRRAGTKSIYSIPKAKSYLKKLNSSSQDN